MDVGGLKLIIANLIRIMNYFKQSIENIMSLSLMFIKEIKWYIQRLMKITIFYFKINRKYQIMSHDQISLLYQNIYNIHFYSHYILLNEIYLNFCNLLSSLIY
jgi:hypothetical protein